MSIKEFERDGYCRCDIETMSELRKGGYEYGKFKYVRSGLYSVYDILGGDGKWVYVFNKKRKDEFVVFLTGMFLKVNPRADRYMKKRFVRMMKTNYLV